MDRALIVLLGAVVAAVGVIGVAAIWLTVTTDDGDPIVLEPGVTEGVSFPAIDHDPAGAAALVTAWQRWRTASFVSVGTWTRTIDARPDEPLTGDVYVAQAPPRRLVVRLGAAEGLEQREADRGADHAEHADQQEGPLPGIQQLAVVSQASEQTDQQASQHIHRERPRGKLT